MTFENIVLCRERSYKRCKVAVFDSIYTYQRPGKVFKK